MIKKILAVVLCMCMIAVPASAMRVQVGVGSTEAYTADVKTKTVQTLTLEAAPYTAQGRTMVPVRVITENLGATVGWNEEEQKVTITQGETVVELVIGSTEAKINGEVKTLDAAPEVNNDRTFVPMRFVGEAFGYVLQWVPSTQQVVISDATVVLKSDYSVATVEDVVVLLSVMAALGDPISEADWLEFYANLMLIGDYRNYELGEIRVGEKAQSDEVFDNLGLTPAAGEALVEMLENFMWYADIAENNPGELERFLQYTNEHPVEKLYSSEEFFVLALEYLKLIEQ